MREEQVGAGPDHRERRQLLQEKREREEAAARLKRVRRPLLFMLAAGAVGGLLVAAAFFLARVETTEVSGRLQDVQEISFVSGSQDDGGISPVCGCAHPEVDAWRGVTFAGRHVEIDRHGGNPWTHWILSGAEPGPMELTGGLKLLRVELVRFRLRGGFRPSWLLEPGLGRRVDVIERAPQLAYELGLATQGPLQVWMGGPVAVGAWIPFPGSHVRLTALRSQFLNEDQKPRIVERYPAKMGFEKRGREQPFEPQIYPLGDFLGPDLVVWSEDQHAQVPGGPFHAPAGTGVVTALVIRGSTFSTRIAASPIGTGELADLRSFGSRPRSSVRVYDPDLGPGSVEVTVVEPLDREQYRDLRDRVQADEFTWVRTVQSYTAIYEDGTEEWVPPHLSREQERYPPLPLYSGLNVFGPLRSVEFHGVDGEVQIGGEGYHLGGSADLALGGVEGFRNGDNAQLISAPLATSEEAAELEFRGVGSAAVNGVPQSTVRSRVDRELAAIGSVITIAAGAMALFFRLRRGRDE